jgi:RNA polymerase sigma-70 factor (ECF subfamily)
MSNETNPLAGLSYNKGVIGIPSADDDADLVTRSRQGDLEAFEQLVTKHQKRMLNIAYRLIGDYDEACEVVQDAFVSVHRNIKTFRGDSKFTTWLTTITLNLSKNRRKQMKSRRSRETYSLDEPVETTDGEMTIDPPSRDPSVLDRLEKCDVQ